RFGGRLLRHLDAELLAGHHADSNHIGILQLAAVLRTEHLRRGERIRYRFLHPTEPALRQHESRGGRHQAHHYAGRCPGHGHDGAHHASDAFLRARNHERRLCTHRAGEGSRRKHGPVRHVLRNALVPVITVVGLELGTLLSGSIIVETVFAWPGSGSLLIAAIQSRDYPLITGTVLTYTIAFVVINFVIDFLYALIDPRIRFGK